MAAPLPEGTRIERLEDGIVLSLPSRPLGKARLIGLLPFGFGLLFGGLPLLGVLKELRTEGGCFAVFSLLFVLPFVAAGTFLSAVGLGLLLPGRMKVGLDPSRLRVRERYGPFWWTWQVPREKIRAMQVRTFPQRMGGEISGVLVVDVLGTSKEFTVGRAYPAAWLEGLRDALLEVHGGARALATVDEPSRPAERPRTGASAQPAGSDAVLEYTADSVRFSFPAKGIWKANGCLLIFGAIWSAISLLAFSVAVVNAEWGAVAFMFLFVAVGAALVLGAVHSGRKRSRLELSGASLTLDASGVFGRSLRRWPRGAIRRMSVEDSGWRVNDVVQWELRVELADAKPLKLLRGRTQEELDWIASVLRSGPLGRMETATAELKGSGAECQVCNSPMTSDIVYCARCRTPHHGQCWQYLGQCSTYGCREIRYTTS